VAEHPHIVTLAGPNGAGNSTAAPALLAGALQLTEFVNADTIARGLCSFGPWVYTVCQARLRTTEKSSSVFRQ
jgi:predicted ABC-type ATPase